MPWITTTEADTLLEYTRPDWAPIDDTKKRQFLALGQRSLEYHKFYDFPKTPTDIMKLGLAEYAYYLTTKEAKSRETRDDLRTAGVTRASIGLVSEAYVNNRIPSEVFSEAYISIPPMVIQILQSYQTLKYGARLGGFA